MLEVLQAFNNIMLIILSITVILMSREIKKLKR